MDSERVDTTTGVQLSELKEIVLRENRPVTVREIARRMEGLSVQQARELLEQLTAQCHLARFNVGLDRYYAAPRVALTDPRPLPLTVIRNSLKAVVVLPWHRASRPTGEAIHPQTVTG